MLDEEDKQRYEAESQQLRLELKTWETTWARDHDGAKPGRADIKQNVDIAHKYTAYNRLRSILSGKSVPRKTKTKNAKNAKNEDARRNDDSVKRKRKTDTEPEPPLQTPSKRLRAVETPLKTGTADVPDDSVTPSISRRLFSPVVPTSIGPTPQRDGRVLGLFDGLVDEASASEKRRSLAATPSKTIESVSTPRKQTLGEFDEDDEEDEDGRRLGRTPMSSAKRNLLDRFTAVTTSTAAAAPSSDHYMFLTPLKARDANAQARGPTESARDPAFETPSKSTTAAQQPFATPAFLRRAPTLPPVDENGEFLSPPTRLRLPRKPLVRGLSSVLANLRKMEDERLDEEMDVLRELEGGEGAPQKTGAPPADLGKDVPAPVAAPPAVLAPDQDGQRLLGGFDDEGLYDSPPEDQKGRDGQPLRVFKKKGQKRTTRLMHMRPTRTRRPEEEEEEHEEHEEDGEHKEKDEKDEKADGHDEDFVPGTSTSKKASKEETGTKTGTVRRAARKVNELAHANFKRLKLRNNGAKGGPGFNSRFRRRR